MANASSTFTIEIEVDPGNVQGAFASLSSQLRGTLTGADTQLNKIDKGLAGVAGSAGKAAQSLSTTRYALYDVSSTLTIAGAALVGLGVATAAVAIAWERDFANVARTTGALGGELEGIRAKMVDLAQTLPASFGDITKIATLGAQLGIANQDLSQFTETVIKFSAATGITAEQSAQAFGRLGNILGVTSREYENLGSSIVKVGVATVATEAEIVAVAQQIGPIARLAGSSAQEIIGLSAAFASVKIPPELARSVVTKTFTDITRAVADGGPKLEAFGKALGISGQQFSQAWQTDATGTFVNFLKAIPEDGIGATKMLDELGLASQRNSPALQKLAQNTGLVTRALEEAGIGFSEATELNRQFGVVSATISARLQILGNNFQAFLDALGSNALGPIGEIVDALSDMFGGLADFAGTDFGGAVLGWAAALGVLAGVLLLAAGGLALFGASSIGLQQGLAGIVAIAPGAASAILGTGTASTIAAGGMGAATAAAKVFAVALRTVLAAALAVGGGIAAANWVTDVIYMFNAANEGIEKGAEASGSRIKQHIDKLVGYFDPAFTGLAHSLQRSLAPMSGDTILRDLVAYDEAMAKAASSGHAGTVAVELESLRKKFVEAGGTSSAFKIAFTDAYKAIGDAGAQGSFGETEEGLAAIETAAAEAEAAINELRDAILNFNDVSVNAEEANLAFLAAMDEIAAGVANAGVTLDGTTQESRDFIQSLIDMESAAGTSAQAIIDNGGSVDEATAKYRVARQAIIDARVAKGEDMATATAWADRVLGTSAEAEGAIAAYSAEVNRVPAAKDTALNNNAPAAGQSARAYREELERTERTYYSYVVTSYSSTGDPTGIDRRLTRATGGAIYGPGSGTSDDVPIWASNGEYMIKTAAHNYYGTAFMNALNSMRLPKFASGGPVGGSGNSGGGMMMGGVVELGPKSLARLTQSVTNNILLDDTAISRATERGNRARRFSGEL